MNDEALRLDNQLCFRLYRLSRLFVRLYQPGLDHLGLTYPQYLVMLVLWEHGSIDYKALGRKLELRTGTLTPIIEKLETRGLVRRTRDPEDSRKTAVVLTEAGGALKVRALELLHTLDESTEFNADQYAEYARVLDDLADALSRIEHRAACCRWNKE
ncbi:MAG: MarR family winged helix-turn-helix transcriptional regulator [Spirochaetota bacterium]